MTGVPSRFFIGWAKPVPVNPLNFTNIRNGELLVSLAGIASNVTLALLAAIIYHLLPLFGLSNSLLANVLQFTVGINLTLAVFNLLPIPPLDGSKALLSQLPYQLAREYEKYSGYGIFILFIMLYFGIVGLILNLVLVPLYNLLGVPPL